MARFGGGQGRPVPARKEVLPRGRRQAPRRGEPRHPSSLSKGEPPRTPNSAPLNAKMDARFGEAAARDAETRQRVDSLASEIKATRAVAEAALAVAAQTREEA